MKHMNNCGRTDTWQARVIIRRGIQVAKNCRAGGTKYSQNNGEQFGASCNNKINGIECRQVYAVIHTDLSVVRNSKSDGHIVSRAHRRVSSESSGAAGGHR